MAVDQPGSPTAFEAVVADYDAGRPHYPPSLYDALPPLGDALELGAGTGIASVELAGRARSLVVTDLGPRMLAAGTAKHTAPGVVARAEALPFADGSFDTVCGAQMWHWTAAPAAPLEAVRVLRHGGTLALWWNEVVGAGTWWFDRQQDRLEAGNPLYRRGYREIDYAAELSAWFDGEAPVEVRWERTVDLDGYDRLLRSKSYVQALDDVDAFVEASRADLLEAFPDGQVVETYVTRLWLLRRRG